MSNIRLTSQLAYEGRMVEQKKKGERKQKIKGNVEESGKRNVITANENWGVGHG